MAVAYGGDVAYYGYVEVRPSVNHGLAVFGHSAVEFLYSCVVGERYGVEVAGSYAAAAAHTVRIVYGHPVLLDVIFEPVVGAFAHAPAASAAQRLVYDRLPVAVLVFLACAGPASHAYVLERTSESGHFVTLEMGQRDEYVGIHDCPAYLRFPYVLTAGDGNRNVVGTLESVGNDHRAAGGKGRESVFPCAIQVFKSVLAASGVKCVAVGKERLPSVFTYYIDNCPGIVWTQKGHVAFLTEMHLYGDELAVHVQFVDACYLYESFKLVGRPFIWPAAEIREIYFCHGDGVEFSDDDKYIKS